MITFNTNTCAKFRFRFIHSGIKIARQNLTAALLVRRNHDRCCINFSIAWMNEWPADCSAYEFTMTNRPLIKVDDCSGNFQSAWRRLFVSRVIIHRPCADEIAVCIVGDPWRHDACDVGVSASVLSTMPFRNSTSHNLNRESSGQTLSWCTVAHKSICTFVETFEYIICVIWNI